jgi:hypothetical protein
MMWRCGTFVENGNKLKNLEEICKKIIELPIFSANSASELVL